MKAERLYREAIGIGYHRQDIYINLGVICRSVGRLEEAMYLYNKAIQINPSNPNIYFNLGNLHHELGNLDQALASTLRSLELSPNDPTTHMNLGSIYKDRGNLDQALASTLRSLELNPDDPTTHMNLGGIYKDRGNLSQALASTIKSLELKPNNPGAVNNLRSFIEQLNFNSTNAKNLERAYELMLNQKDVSHQKLSKLFLELFLSTIQKASASEPIISESNKALKALASDWRFQKSLSLMIPPSAKAEGFFTRLREELLRLTIKKGTIPPQFKRLQEALATQCFLNEYVYASSPEELEYINKLIDRAASDQKGTNQYLAIIACYKAINATGISPELINNYPTPDDSSKELITTQFKEPCWEKAIIASLQEKKNITNTTSRLTKDMYEKNPYPRYRYSDYKNSKLARPIYESIETETTKKNLSFTEELKSPAATPKVLIAGCGTGNQVIVASRYKNAAITAIDLSSSSLAYTIRKTKEYKMTNATLKQIDLLDVSDLGEIFDIIECSGVLHHMEKPSNGLSALINQLKPGGYIKLALYSETARKVIAKTREIIQTRRINSTPDSIRNFRKKVLDGEIEELQDLPKFVKDFYSLSECRDLCFHVQEHRYTTELLQKLLDANGLTFCGFMVPEKIKKLYQEQYPEDVDMTSLPNWGKFEEEYPSTFKSMYQFWAYKQS